MLIFKEQVVLHSGCAWNCNHFWTFDKETTTSELTAVLHQHGSGFFFFFCGRCFCSCDTETKNRRRDDA